MTMQNTQEIVCSDWSFSAAGCPNSCRFKIHITASDRLTTTLLKCMYLVRTCFDFMLKRQHLKWLLITQDNWKTAKYLKVIWKMFECM